MPFFIYLAAGGLLLVSAMFFDVMLEKGRPGLFTSDRYDLPNVARLDLTQRLATTPAPAPAMTAPRPT